MFGSRGRGFAIAAALHKAREEEKLRQVGHLGPTAARLNNINNGMKEESSSISSSSTESLCQYTSKIKISRNTNERNGSEEVSRHTSEESLESYKNDRSLSRSDFSTTDKYRDENISEKKFENNLWYGSSGEKIDLLTNCIELHVSKERQQAGFFEHQVRFEPELDSRSLRRKILNSRQDLLGPAIIFDGFSLFLPSRCRHDYIESKNKKHKIYINFIKNRNYKDANNVTIFNLLIKQVCSALNMVQIRKNYFLPSRAQIIEKHKLEVWPGYVMSVNDYGSSGLLLQCDMKSKILRTQTVHDVIRDIITNCREGQNSDIQAKIKKTLIGQCVLTKYNNKSYRVDDVDFYMNPASTFDMNGTQESFKNYYDQHYQITVKDMGQPLLIHHPKIPRIIDQNSRSNYGLICLIPELCYMTGLSDPMRSNFSLMKDLSTVTKMSPFQRKNRIQKFLEEVRSNSDAQNILQKWGLNVATKAFPLEGRILQPYIIRFGEGYKIEACGDFSAGTLRMPVVGPVSVENWLLLFDQRNREYAKSFVSFYNEASKDLKITVSEPQIIPLSVGRTDEFVKKIRSHLQRDNSIQLVVTIVDSPRSDLYSAVKKVCLVDHSVASQFILRKTLCPTKNLRNIVKKIALQINCKLGGKLWDGHSPYKNAMIVGIDVYHDPDRQHQSCLGFVASLNTSFTQWYSTTERHSNNEEIANALGKCIYRAIKEYKQQNHCIPSRIVVYRDGVGDGRMNMVNEFEVPQMLKMYRSLSPDSSTPLKFTLIIVSKRVNTKVIVLNEKSAFNPPQGTVVDHSITENRTYPNFYLVSQKVGEGTVTPTHYTIAYDNSDLSAEHAQKLSYWLTYMYYNWPGAIRVPVPCQYAHKLAALVGEFIGKETNPALSNKLFFL
ncbi:piwi-like protein Ago3 isoform X1 [Lepeophtheirus salmonis]|uniref:piwi-like protein Ago3 isoform X1 n=1 Tax=Lepeophtheirus salmonis TaxID=72036 RepID=UPI001AE3C877|nr:piwi-like protein Ago3 isoform X1 [Lepeophtheirus salmonis]XP_040567828.1 piwi-like protein Ago3 isoform X1 [Lepeophtheirus salmonis]XP_040567829.1 piwi-like protein Ago3 isoform X1 [Lepeophtheirus salmonis]XP_040567830.1 piwi-like protein Ago3 isoform X1 [Lepeophtheirus salmonis]XP_040567831.1 piwi-like protein Ago3 isoform X1 [Lepeophtheirus salmonis]XP_040567833.1 piwi-like protein Ago3 isoform X1 [Lepeophtheirus salmonis]XP_040567834.1 piwi-like protein Ago3 isoform X1 [Lepeophtheirus 